jgi:hypothetical protein
MSKPLISYDPVKRRVWIGTQRLHHGVTGIAIATAGLTVVVVRRVSGRRGLPIALLGGALIAHDWHDRSVWFRRGA